MKFKIDENLPVEMANLLRSAHHDATTVVDQGLRGEDDVRIIEACLQEGRALVTLDLDFADIRTYPPQRFPGLMVLRVRRQDKRHLLAVFRRVIPLIAREPVRHHLWITGLWRISVMVNLTTTYCGSQTFHTTIYGQKLTITHFRQCPVDY